MNIREKIYENVRALCKLHNEYLGVIEKDIAGISPGYLSRKTKALKVETVYTIAKHFNVTIDDLIERDYWEIYKTQFAEAELNDAVRLAKKAMRGCDVLEVVNRILEGSET